MCYNPLFVFKTFLISCAEMALLVSSYTKRVGYNTSGLGIMYETLKTLNGIKEKWNGEKINFGIFCT